MITSWQLYWLTRLDEITGTANIIAWVSGAISVFMFIIFILCDQLYEEEKAAKFKKAWFLGLAWFIPSCFLSVAVPKTKEMAAILILPKIINNEKVQELPDNLLNLANEWIKELSPEERKAE